MSHGTRRFLDAISRAEEFRFVGDVPQFAVVLIQAALLFEVEWSRADAAEDAELVAGFINGSVAIDAFGDAEGVAVLRQLLRRDQARNRACREAHVARRFGTGELDNSQAVVAVG